MPTNDIDALELLARVKKQVTEYPETWYQSTWFSAVEAVNRRLEGAAPSLSRASALESAYAGDTPWDCATAACVAGHACLLAGDRPIADGLVLTVDGDKVAAADRAQELLRLSGEEADELFAGWNDELSRVVALLDEHEVRLRARIEADA